MRTLLFRDCLNVAISMCWAEREKYRRVSQYNIARISISVKSPCMCFVCSEMGKGVLR